jgi:hypothetical protein
VLTYLGRGDGHFDSGQSFNVFPDTPDIAVGDLNGDGTPDVLESRSQPDSTNGSIGLMFGLGRGILVGLGGGAFQPSTPYLTGFGFNSRPSSVRIADVSGDGRPDIVVGLEGDGRNNSGVAFLDGSGDGTFQLALDVHTQPVAGVATGNLRDQRVDVALTEFWFDQYGDLHDQVEVLLNTSASADTTAPTFTASGLTAEATGPSGAVVNFSVAASDVDDAAGPVSCTPASGSLFALGSTTISCASTDTHGNKGTAPFTVVVQDTTAPTVQNIADIVAKPPGPAAQP